MKTPLLRDQFELIAYRGGASERPENTMAAFQHAIRLSPEIILDLDLQFARDHTVVVFHDTTLERTTNGSGHVSDHSIAELKQLDAAFHFVDSSNDYAFRGQGITIPTLEEVLDAFHKARFILDIRRHDATHIHRVIDVVDRLEATDRVIIVSEMDDVIDACRTVHPEWIYGAPTNESRLVVFGAQPPTSQVFMLPEVHDTVQVVSDALLERLHEEDRKVWVWTIDEVDDCDRLRQMGVDGIFTNCPERLLHQQ